MEYRQNPQQWYEESLYPQGENARNQKWFAVRGDVDDFIFYDNDCLTEDDNDPHSYR